MEGNINVHKPVEGPDGPVELEAIGDATEQTEVEPISLGNVVPRITWAPNPAGEQSFSRLGGGMNNCGGTNSGAGRR